jgi:hypothetical protein
MFDLSSAIPVQNESSSKGNQLKFYHQGYWIKLDNDRLAYYYGKGVYEYV